MFCRRWLRAATTVVLSSSAFSREDAIRIGIAALNSRIASSSRPARISPTASVPRADAVSKWFSPTRAICFFTSCSAAAMPASIWPGA